MTREALELWASTYDSARLYQAALAHLERAEAAEREFEERRYETAEWIVSQQDRLAAAELAAAAMRSALGCALGVHLSASPQHAVWITEPDDLIARQPHSTRCPGCAARIALATDAGARVAAVVAAAEKWMDTRCRRTEGKAFERLVNDADSAESDLIAAIDAMREGKP